MLTLSMERRKTLQASSEILSNILNGLTSNRKYGTERVEQFIKKN